jgi:hypothetical protein
MSLQTLDPYKVFKVGPNFTLDEIKQKYRRLALKLHPDKNQGNPDAAQLFAAIQHCYQELLEQYCMRISDKQYSDLKNESQDFLRQQQQPTDAKRQAPSAGSGLRTKFDVARFNELFMQHRVGDAYDDGYGEWMKQAPPEAQAMQKNQLAVHRPNALFMTPANTYELGVTRVQDYSKPCTVDMAATPGRGSRGIEYTDYRVAHTTSQLLAPSSSKTPARTSYANVDQLEKERASMSHTMTPEECARYAAEQRKEAKREQRRQQALREQDQRMFSQYNRMHSLLAG